MKLSLFIRIQQSVASEIGEIENSERLNENDVQRTELDIQSVSL